MRKIERLMCNAVALRVPWQLNNTTVTVTKENDPNHQFHTSDYVTVYLHGNRIAYQDRYHPHELRIDHATLKKYPTRTTTSRLRALGFDLYTSKGVVCVRKDITHI